MEVLLARVFVRDSCAKMELLPSQTETEDEVSRTAAQAGAWRLQTPQRLAGRVASDPSLPQAARGPRDRPGGWAGPLAPGLILF